MSSDVAALLREGRDTLRALDDGDREAELLLGHALGRSSSWLYAHPESVPDAADCARYRDWLRCRAEGTPVAHLTGRRGFWSLDLQVGPATLIPRPETELLVELALQRLPVDQPLWVADLGTGSGAIALSLARERQQAQMVAVDCSIDALAIAERNARALGLAVELLHGDWWTPLAGRRFDLVASNPPYIADDDPHLQQGDLRFEPRKALASGSDGLDAIRSIVGAAMQHLEPGGWLLVEHGWQQGTAVRALFEAAGFDGVTTARDLEERERVTLGCRRVD